MRRNDLIETLSNISWGLATRGFDYSAKTIDDLIEKIREEGIDNA